MLVRFWGVRGSISTPGPSTIRFGGNTPCLEVETAHGEGFIVDAGYGVVALGQQLLQAAAGRPISVHILLTHLHWDHIQGLPFFAPLYVPGNKVIIHSASVGAAQGAMARLFTSIYSPIMGVENLGAEVEHRQLDGEPLELAGAIVTPVPLFHSVPVLGLHVEADGQRVVHATDHEAGDQQSDAPLLLAAQGADLLIHDAQFSAEEYRQYQGWGHSSTDAAVKTARQASVGRVVLFHYDPTHDDDQVASELRRAQELAGEQGPEVLAAAELMSIDLSQMR